MVALVRSLSAEQFVQNYYLVKESYQLPIQWPYRTSKCSLSY